ncbi:MAG: pyridoxal phosphate-dependent aminotransferase [Acidobacteria bacterium]|nr:pyridoxal phosphate-dependent aminotransferase [Acidobacteriota bacterium]MCI0723696.1 pyridoxal phosphate-dependent aminotransferase [Acidobacteriota bacterium]
MFFSPIANSFPQALNRLYQARDAALQNGKQVVDLISGNVNQAGIQYPEALLRAALLQALPETRCYQPDSFGQPAARQAISSYYAEAGVTLPPDQFLLTPGSSISYFYCFRLLAESGDEILCPSPSYPLFETIAQLGNVRLTSYLLKESRNWEIDLDYLESQLTTRTRAIVLISPHNPTGAVAGWTQLRGLAEIASRHGLPLIADEVFSEFLFAMEQLPRPAQTAAPLVFTLNGLSKMLALPGMKLGWLGVSGDPALVKKSMRALEMISDTFLPVNELVQFAVPEILRAGRPFLSDYRSRVAGCRDLAARSLSQCRKLALVLPSGGFYLTARWLDPDRDEESWVIDLLNRCGVLVHPGYFYDVPETHLVMTFVQEPQLLESALQRLAEFVDG